MESIKKISICQLNKIQMCRDFIIHRKGEFDHIVKGQIGHCAPAIGAIRPNSG